MGSVERGKGGREEEFEGVRVGEETGLINFAFLRREEIKRKQLEEEKLRKKMEKKVEVEVSSRDKLKWAKEVYGRPSKKDIAEGGMKLLENLKGNEVDAFKEMWEMTYFADMKKFCELFGEEKGPQMYFSCLVDRQHVKVFNSLPKKEKKESGSAKKKKTPKRDLASYFSQMKNAPTEKQKKQKMDKDKNKKSAMKKDPENLRKLDEMILVMGTGQSKKNFDTVTLQKIKKQFAYFSERKILMRVKELLRFGYLLSREHLLSLLGTDDSQSFAKLQENKEKGGILNLLQTDAQHRMKIAKQAVEDFFFKEQLHVKLTERFSENK